MRRSYGRSPKNWAAFIARKRATDLVGVLALALAWMGSGLVDAGGSVLALSARLTRMVQRMSPSRAGLPVRLDEPNGREVDDGGRRV